MYKQELLNLQDLKYQEFQRKLIQNIDPDTIIGVRVPNVKALAKRIAGDEKTKEFLKSLPHDYYEEDLLHVCLINLIKDYDEAIAYIEEFVPYITNWATNDTLSPKCLNKNKKDLLKRIKRWIKSKKEYSIRFGVSCLMTYFLDDDFDVKYLKMVADIKSDKYYVNMMNAWYFATALAKHYEETIPYIDNYLLAADVHNKTIQKAVESFRISDEQKAHLKTKRLARSKMK